jgi:predicted O-methyltransferase YrrM
MYLIETEQRMGFEDKYRLAAMPPRSLPSQWWIGHIPFAFEMIKALRPERIVELGVYSGASLMAFCQAVEKLKLSTKCYGIDLWEGDIHMGEFDDSIYDDISEYCSRHYADTAVLIRKRFDDAVDDFEDGSVDLLHIDGTHTLEAVSNDYHAWLPKMSDRGVVLFHDTNATYETVGPGAKDFGVKAFFDSVKTVYPHIEFKHCYGLGVLVVGRNAPEAVLDIVEDASDPKFIEYFANLGERISKRFEKGELEKADLLTSHFRRVFRFIKDYGRNIRNRVLAWSKART